MSSQTSDVAGFFFDNNVSPYLVEGLRAFGEPVFHLREIWPQDPGDTIWLPEIGRRRWILVTYDVAIRKKPRELAVFRESGVGGFFLSSRHRPSRCDMIEQLVRQWRLIKRTAHAMPRPFMAKVRTRGQELKFLLRP